MEKIRKKKSKPQPNHPVFTHLRSEREKLNSYILKNSCFFCVDTRMPNNKAKWDSSTNNYNLILLLYLSLYSYSLN